MAVLLIQFIDDICKSIYRCLNMSFMFASLICVYAVLDTPKTNVNKPNTTKKDTVSNNAPSTSRDTNNTSIPKPNVNKPNTIKKDAVSNNSPSASRDTNNTTAPKKETASKLSYKIREGSDFKSITCGPPPKNLKYISGKMHTIISDGTVSIAGVPKVVYEITDFIRRALSPMLKLSDEETMNRVFEGIQDPTHVVISDNTENKKIKRKANFTQPIKDVSLDIESLFEKIKNHIEEDPIEIDNLIEKNLDQFVTMRANQNNVRSLTLTAADIKALYEFYYTIAYKRCRGKEPVNLFYYYIVACISKAVSKGFGSFELNIKELQEKTFALHHALKFLLDIQLLEWCYHFDQIFPDENNVPDVLRVLSNSNL